MQSVRDEQLVKQIGANGFALFGCWQDSRVATGFFSLDA